MRCVFITFLIAYCSIGTAGASDILVDLDPNKAPSLTPNEQCTDAIINAAMPIWPKDALRSGAVGWAIVRYDLDGGGRGQNVDIAASAPQQVFDKASLDSIKRSKFTTGFIKAGCKAVFVYSLTANK
jgi:TonB family protein